MANNNNQNKYAGLESLQAFLANLKSIFASKIEVDEKINEVKEDASDKDVVVLLEAQKGIDGVQTALDAHVNNEDIHITTTERNNWNTAYANSTSVDNKIATHNTSTSAHNDIRVLINDLTTRLNTLANSDDTTLDQMSEIVAYIKNNKSLIDGITTSKVNVSDIVNNLTTNVTSKVLSAAQGVAIKNLIDELEDAVSGKVDSSVLNNYYTKTQIDNLELITINDIDTICGATIQVASLDNEVSF